MSTPDFVPHQPEPKKVRGVDLATAMNLIEICKSCGDPASQHYDTDKGKPVNRGKGRCNHGKCACQEYKPKIIDKRNGEELVW